MVRLDRIYTKSGDDGTTSLGDGKRVPKHHLRVEAWMHVARNVCRRAERLVSELGARAEEQGRVNPEVLKYLNRLSDLLFVLARVLNDEGKADVLWKPGARRG